MTIGLNYHHLLYFWTVAKEGSIAAASKKLRLAQPTISAQIKTLEEQLGVVLFDRSGRTLVLTEVGQTVFGYAESIFSLGREMIESLEGGTTVRHRLRVGITQAIPEVVVYEVLRPALGGDSLRVVCIEERLSRLLARLTSHDLDLILSDSTVGPDAGIHAHNRLLGQSPITFFATATMAKKLGRDFPRSLEGAPLLLPLPGSVLRDELDQWFEHEQVRPDVVGEFEDSTLAKVFGQSGVGAFVGPSVMEAAIAKQYHVQPFGRTDSVHERYYAISIDRRDNHPGVQAISGRNDIFATE